MTVRTGSTPAARHLRAPHKRRLAKAPVGHVRANGSLWPSARGGRRRKWPCTSCPCNRCPGQPCTRVLCLQHKGFLPTALGALSMARTIATGYAASLSRWLKTLPMLLHRRLPQNNDSIMQTIVALWKWIPTFNTLIMQDLKAKDLICFLSWKRRPRMKCGGGVRVKFNTGCRTEKSHWLQRMMSRCS